MEDRMDLRKVQLTGGSSIAITLPKTWVDKAQIRPGDVVGCLQQADGSLSIHPHAKSGRSPQKYAIDVTIEAGDALFRKIIAAYLMGFDQIEIKSKKPLSPELRQVIRTAVRRIIGLEIVEEQPNTISLQDFLDPREFHMEKALRRMGMLLQAMHDEAFNALVDHKPQIRESMEDRDDEVDRLYWLINKQYHAILRDGSYGAKMGLDASQALNYLLAARLIERTADHAARIASESVLITEAKIPGPLVQRLEKQGRKAAELLQAALQTFFRKDWVKANQVIDEAQKFLDSQKRLLKETADTVGETVVHLTYIMESISRTAAYATDISEVAVNHVVANSGSD